MIFGPKVQATLVILAAAVVGASAATVWERTRPSDGPEISERRDGRGRRGDRSRNPFDRLDLSPDQQEAMQAIMERYEPRTRAVMDEMIPRLRAIRDSARAEMDSILTEEQRAALAEMDNFWDRRGRRGGRRGPGGPPPDRARDSTRN